MSANFATLLRAYRKNMNWTQEQLAQNWSYSFETISAWERQKRYPNNQEIPRIAKFLEMKTEDLADIVIDSKFDQSGNKSNTSPQTRASWKANYETWEELQRIYRTRTEFNKDFSYPKMFDNAHSIFTAGISLNAIAMNYDRELIKRAILEKNCRLQLCFLDPYGNRCKEREEEEGYEPGILETLTNTNLVIIKSLQRRIAQVDQEKSKQLDIRTYNMIPRFNIYIVNDTLMTVQGYAYGRGEETPTLVLERKTTGGLFDFYVSVAMHILENSREYNKL
jgi:transcriptional regulator with XRE-family HTH domain